MTLIQVIYPFEVDEEEGANCTLYPTMKAAREGAADTFAGQANYETYRQEFSNGPLAGEPALVRRVTVRKLTPQAVCDVLNSHGHEWVESHEVLGEFRWAGKRLKFKKDPLAGPPSRV